MERWLWKRAGTISATIYLATGPWLSLRGLAGHYIYQTATGDEGNCRDLALAPSSFVIPFYFYEVFPRYGVTHMAGVCSRGALSDKPSDKQLAAGQAKERGQKRQKL